MLEVTHAWFNAELQDVQSFAMAANVELETWTQWECKEPEKAMNPRIRHYKVGYRWDGVLHLMFDQLWPLTLESQYRFDEYEIMLFKGRIGLVTK